MPTKPLQILLEEATADRLFAGYSLLTQRAKEITTLVGGATSYWGGAVSISPHTYFDIGSVTKALVTTSVLARGVAGGKLRLESTLGEFLPAVKGTWLAPLSIQDLLSHRAGLSGWLPLYQKTTKSEWLGWLVKAEREARSPRPSPEYSDVGFLLLGQVIEAIWGGLDKAFQDEVVIPLKLQEVGYGRPPKGASVAATEFCLWRKRVLEGEVFDENCFHLGGVCGHAGVFATARGLLPWAGEWLAATQGSSVWLPKEVALRFVTKRGGLSQSSWGLGWDTKSPQGSSAGQKFSTSSFGHLGFPGVSVWIDPVAKGVAIFLTNRIHPSRYDERIRALRPQIHDLVHESWKEKT